MLLKNVTEVLDTETETETETVAEVELDESEEAPQEEGGTTDQAGAEEDTAEAESEEVQITIGDEAAPVPEEDDKKAPEWVRNLRQNDREKTRKLREYEQEIARLKGTTSQPQAVVLGDKPTLESCDYDTDKYEADVEKWHERKREVDDQQRKRSESEEQAKAAWQKVLDGYGKAKAALKVQDFEDAESVVLEATSQVQQGIILNGLDRPEVMVYALGRNPKKLKELASITDPVKFAVAVAKLETQLKVTPRKTAPTPERVVRSAVAGSSAVDNTLEKLRAEAAKTGDLSKVVAYRNAQRTKQRA